MIELPRERTKNNRRHDIPMAAAVCALLKARKKDNGRELVLGAAMARIPAGRRRRPRSTSNRPAEAWVVHDLRRTAATGMAGIGVQPHVIEAVLNHVSGHKGGIAGIYNRAQYSAEKAQALARWDEHVSAIIKGGKSKVTPLRGRR